MSAPGRVAHGIMFHHFHDARHRRGQGSLSQPDFERILQGVDPRRILSPQAWLERVERGTLEPGDLCLTFDDGLRCQFDIALPVLQHYGLTAFWFIYSSVFEGQVGRLEVYRAFRTQCFSGIDEFYALFFQAVSASPFSSHVEAVVHERAINHYVASFPFYSVNDVKFRLIRDRVLGRAAYEALMDRMILARGMTLSELSKGLWMSNEQLRELAASGHVIGLHSYSHPTALAGLSPEEQTEEYVKNYRHVKEVCHQVPVCMAHPCNSYGDDTIEILRHLGIRCGFRSNLSAPRPGRRINPTPFELAREDHANLMEVLNRSTTEAEGLVVRGAGTG